MYNPYVTHNIYMHNYTHTHMYASHPCTMYRTYSTRELSIIRLSAEATVGMLTEAMLDSWYCLFEVNIPPVSDCSFLMAIVTADRTVFIKVGYKYDKYGT